MRNYTNIGGGLKKAREQFETLPASENGRNRFIILLTDGITNVSDVPGLTPQQFALQQADAAQDMDVKIFVIGLGVYVNESDLRAIASPDGQGGMLYFGARASDLQDIYNRIAEQIISYNLNQKSWIEK